MQESVFCFKIPFSREIYIVTCYATEDAVHIVNWFYYNLTVIYNTITSLH
jgi:hypothetical protein